MERDNRRTQDVAYARHNKVERFTDDFINAVTDSYRLAVEERKSREARMAVQAEEYTPTLA